MEIHFKILRMDRPYSFGGNEGSKDVLQAQHGWTLWYDTEARCVFAYHKDSPGVWHWIPESHCRPSVLAADMTPKQKTTAQNPPAVVRPK